MAAERRYYTYTDGNAVRVERPQERPERVYIDGERVKTGERQLHRREAAAGISGAYAAFLAVSVAVCLSLCVYYLNIQAQINSTKSSIESLSDQIEVLTTENEALNYSINSYIDLDYIYEVATEDLGMVVASADQISVYERTESEYVSQSQDIPLE